MNIKSFSLKKHLTNFLFVILGVILLSLPLSNIASADYPPGVISPSEVAPPPSTPGSSILSQFAGTYDPSTSPASTVIAVSSNEVLQLVNDKYSLTNRSGGVISVGTTAALTHTSGDFLTDPQVMWDPSTNRFYFSLLENQITNGVVNDGIGWGFSKTATPTSAASFCSYFNAFNYGSTSFPDRQSLGDTSKFLMWSSLRISNTNSDLLGSDIAWASKPPAGSTCPAQSSFKSGIQSILNANSSTLTYPNLPYPYYPVAAKQVDSSPNGWVVGLPSYVSGNYLTVIKVGTNSSGLPVFGAPQNLYVSSYNYPPPAPQAGTTISGSPAPPLETNLSFDGAYMAFDPNVGQDVVWTSDTIAGGAGTAVRWYEINGPANSLAQSGTISSPTLDYFNSAISSDRAVYGTVAKYGRNMAITFNSSSTTSYPAIWYEAKEGLSAAFAPELITQSTGPSIDFTCSEPNTIACRYGDWAGAAPDPVAATTKTAAGGQVWLSNEWNLPDQNDSTPVWRTEIARVNFY